MVRGEPDGTRSGTDRVPREPPPGTAAPATLELHDIRKTYGSVRANDGVSLTIEAGTLHGLLGENGAGKSTLMKILSGYLSADSGTISLGGRRLDLASPRDAIRAGIGMLHQDPLVFLPFTTIDNFLACAPGGLGVDRSAGRRELGRMADRFGFSFDPDRPARNLTVGERQQLEIVRLLWLGAKVLILDEPTTGISATQRTELFDALRLLADDGMIVIFVSHKLDEVDELCGRVSVLRRGRVVGEADLPHPTDQLVEMMFGRVFAGPEPSTEDPGNAVVSLEGVRLQDRGELARPLDLAVREREVVGLAGLEGSGQRTLLRTLAGLVRADEGRVSIDGRDLTRRPYRDYLRAGVYFIPAGRLEEGLVSGLTITDHVALTDEHQGFLIDRGAAEERAREKIRDFAVVGTPATRAEALSGGNQQRLLLAMAPPRVRALLLEHPTRGLDIESAAWVWSQLLERREEGTAIVYASADLDELLRYSDRILVFFAGAVLRELDARTTTGEELGHLIGGSEVLE